MKKAKLVWNIHGVLVNPNPVSAAKEAAKKAAKEASAEAKQAILDAAPKHWNIKGELVSNTFLI